MTELEKAARQALEALEWQQEMLITAMQYSAAKGMTFLGHPPNPNDAITALRRALEQQEFDRVHETLEKEAGIHVSQQPDEEPVALDVTLDGDEAKLLHDMLGDDRDELSPVRLLVGNGHSGHGLYAASADYQEEGAVLLAATRPQPAAQWVEVEEIKLHGDRLMAKLREKNA